MTEGAGPTRIGVREARPEDLGRLVELLGLGALVPGKEDPSRLGDYADALAEIEATPGSAVLVAVSRGAGPGPGGEVVGLCQLAVFRHLQARGGRCAEIESMHVHPDWRSRGVGGILLEAAVARAAEAGCYRVQLTSNLARVDAHRFYAAHGFEPSHLGFKRPLRPPG